jgi:hypothetical protein
MKVKWLFILMLLGGLMATKRSNAQTSSAYTLPESYRFDYAVDQLLYHNGKMTDTSVMHFFYTKSGDDAAIRINDKRNRKGNLFVVLTRESMCIIFDEHHKDITIISLRKLGSDLMNLTKWIRMDSLAAQMHKKTDGKVFQSVKTGKTKQVGNYTSEEFVITGRKGQKGSVWCAKVDFLTQGDYLLTAIGGNWLTMISNQQTAHPLFQALTQPKTLVTEIDIRDSTGARKIEMHTVNINPISTTISTNGYAVNDYSNMTLPEILEAEMKKRNN